MAVTLVSFRQAFPAFASPVDYPEPMVTLWLDTATQLVNASRWGALTDLGVQLAAAHYLAIESKAAKSGQAGQTPGGSVGILTSKSAQGVSGSYDVSTATEKDAGHWNMTTYGLRFYRLAKLMGAGPLQIGAPGPGDVPAGHAWPGVLQQFW